MFSGISLALPPEKTMAEAVLDRLALQEFKLGIEDTQADIAGRHQVTELFGLRVGFDPDDLDIIAVRFAGHQVPVADPQRHRV